MKGRPLTFKKASASAKAATGIEVKNQNQKVNKNQLISIIAAAAARYINCLSVKGPIILSSMSMNCGI